MRDHFIGIDLGGTRIKLGLVSDGKIVAKKIVPADAKGGLAATLRMLEREIGGLFQTSGLPMASLGGIGLAFPALVDVVSQRILATNKEYEDVMQVDIAAWVKQRWAVPYFIDNDARMAAVGEWKYGAGRDTQDMVMMTIGTGIGTSVVMGGRLLRGRHFQAGILGGHLSVRYDGRVCNCGNIGCLEAYGATWSLNENVRKTDGFGGSLLAGAAVIDLAAVFEAADKGDVFAGRVRQDCFELWSAGVVNLIHAYDPEVVVIGGGVMSRSDEILPYITAHVHRHAWTPWGKVAIRCTGLHSDAGVLGVAHCLQYNL